MIMLKVAFAWDEQLQELVPPERAERNRLYRCPGCQEPVSLKAGAVRVAHFAHRPNGLCTPESLLHVTAKQLIQQAIQRWRRGEANPPLLARACAVCNARIEQPVPNKVEEAQLEYHLPEGFVVDVALLGEGQAQAAIEVRVTHAVDELKAATLSVPFIEVEGAAILQAPTRWVAIRDHFRPLHCQRCRERLRQFKARARALAADLGINLPTTYYRYAPCTCWRCKKEILAFTWPGYEGHGEVHPPIFLAHPLSSIGTPRPSRGNTGPTPVRTVR